MQVVSRLKVQWPEVADALGELSGDRQRELAMRAAAAALEATGQRTPEGDERAVSAEVQRLDELAWDTQEDDSAPPDTYPQAFRRARAVNSFALAHFGGDPADAIYEALHALDAPTDGTFILSM